MGCHSCFTERSMWSPVSRFPLLLVLITAYFGYRGCSGLEIQRVEYPQPLENASQPAILLDCDYKYGEEDKLGFMVKWYHDNKPEPVYQWIPPQPPQDLGVLEGRLDLTYSASDDEYETHRALRILWPTVELSGEYRCQVSSFHSEDSKTFEISIYAADSPYTKKATSGESVELPCDIDEATCGNVFSIKWYRRNTRVHIASPTSNYERAEADFASPVNRSTFVFRPGSPAFLRINPVRVTDEAPYKCEVTYVTVKSGCTTVTFVELFTIARPDPPLLFLEHEGEETVVTSQIIGPYYEDDNIHMRCLSGNGKPAASVTWWNGTETLDSGGRYRKEYSEDGTGTGISEVDVPLTRNDILTRYECQIVNDALESPLVGWVEVDVYVRPSSLRLIGGSHEVTEGALMELVCEAAGARPAVNITWYNGTDVLDDQPITEVRPDSDINDKTYTSRSALMFHVTRYDNGETMTCEATVDKPMMTKREPIIQSVSLRVLYAPMVSIEPEGTVLINETDSVTLLCNYEANPSNLTRVVWLKDGSPILGDEHDADDEEMSGISGDYLISGSGSGTELLNIPASDMDTSGSGVAGDGSGSDWKQYDEMTRRRRRRHVGTSKQKKSISDDSDNLYIHHQEVKGSSRHRRTDRSRLVRVPGGIDGEPPKLILKDITRDDTGMYTCMVENKVGAGRSLNSANITVLYPPEVHLEVHPTNILDEKTVNVTLTCAVDAASPPLILTVHWYKDDELYAETSEATLVIDEIHRSHHGNYSCRAENLVGWSNVSLEEGLEIRYTPGQASLSYSPLIVVKDMSVTLTCDVTDLGNPPDTRFRWKRNEFLIADVHSRNWTIEPVTLDTQADYSCAAVNSVGEGLEANLTLNVNAPPSFIDPLLPYVGALVTASDVSISCRVECWPTCEIEWLKDGLLIDFDESLLYTEKVSQLPPDARFNDFQSVVSTLRWNMTAWPGGRLDRYHDNANYTCRSTGNLVGPGVSSTSYFRVEYPPENITLTSTVMEVEEGDVPDPVHCHASAYPESSYVWTYNDKDVVSSGEVLHLNYAITRDKQGTYTCTASNRHGNASTMVYLNVLYIPECSLEERDVAEYGPALVCEVAANPENVQFTWFLNNETVGEEWLKTGGLASFLTPVQHFGEYICIVNNTVGESKPCIKTLEGMTESWYESWAQTKKTVMIFAIVAGILMALIIAILLLVCIRKKKASGKYDNTMGLQDRETSENHQQLDTRIKVKPSSKTGVVTFKRVDPDTNDKQKPQDNEAYFGKKKGADGAADGDRAFYENLPFHGLQPPPNKTNTSALTSTPTSSSVAPIATPTTTFTTEITPGRTEGAITEPVSIISSSSSPTALIPPPLPTSSPPSSLSSSQAAKLAVDPPSLSSSTSSIPSSQPPPQPHSYPPYSPTSTFSSSSSSLPPPLGLPLPPPLVPPFPTREGIIYADLQLTRALGASGDSRETDSMISSPIGHSLMRPGVKRKETPVQYAVLNFPGRLRESHASEV